MAADPRRRDAFVNICAYPENQAKSQEEIRMEDYLKAYTTTGGPPLPVVQEPAGAQARAALGLPPLFEPYTEPAVGESSTSSVVASTAPTTDPAKLPRIHAFQPVQSEGDTYQSIAAVPEYSFFSHEELRCYAYAAGVIMPPTPLPLDLPPIRLSPATSRSAEVLVTPDMHPFFAKDNKTNAFYDEPVDGPASGNLYYHSISASRRHNRHSFEELRVAFLTNGRELDSTELLGPLPAAVATPGISPTASTNAPFGLFAASGTGGGFTQSPAVRPF
ncbi:hypothetical protein HWV62_41810 [Athelia sp. TMB]|nr:hypothetical protein HWV62_41810 [Athelia sp. TMB]